MMTDKSTFWAEQSAEFNQLDIDRMIEQYPYMSHLHIMKALQQKGDTETAAKATLYCPSRQWWKTSSTEDAVIPVKPSAQIIPIRREQKQVVALAEVIENHRVESTMETAPRDIADLYTTDDSARLAPMELIYQSEAPASVSTNTETKSVEVAAKTTTIVEELLDDMPPSYSEIRPQAKISSLPQTNTQSDLLSFLKGLKPPVQRVLAVETDLEDSEFTVEELVEDSTPIEPIKNVVETKSAFALSAELTGTITPRAEKSKKSKKSKKKKKKLKLKKMPVSETLANLLWVQGHRKKALKMYKKLYKSALNNSEKKTYFAARIKKLKKIKKD